MAGSESSNQSITVMATRHVPIARPRVRRLLERGGQEGRGHAGGAGGYLAGCTGGDDAAAVLAAAGSEVDDVVGTGDDGHVVLDDDHRVARVDQRVQLPRQQRDVDRMQAGRRLVEDEERVPAAGALELAGQLDPLRLATGQFRGRLAEGEVAETYLA